MANNEDESAARANRPSRYESQKRRDWNTFLNYLHNYVPPMPVRGCGGQQVVDFMRYLDQFGKTKVHLGACPFFGRPNPPGPCGCPQRQAWGSLDALVGRLRAAYEENGGHSESNPFASRQVREYLREVRDLQSRARGVSYHKKRRRNSTGNQLTQGNSSSQGSPSPINNEGLHLQFHHPDSHVLEGPSSSTHHHMIGFHGM